MDFTREPIIETVISPREGCKLVVRSSKSTGQEEYFVDALEVVSFGHSFFFRSLERPKSFLVPATDYEVLEVREPRMALKNVGLDRKIKIAGGRESHKAREVKEPIKEEKEEQKDQRGDARRDRKRGVRRRRGRGDRPEENLVEAHESSDPVDLNKDPQTVDKASMEEVRTTSSFVSSLLPPPPTLISEQIQKYKQDDMYKDAFFADKSPKVESEAALPEADVPMPVETPAAKPEEVVVSDETTDSSS